MEKDKSPSHSGVFPPLSGRYSVFSPPRNTFNVKPEASSSIFPPLNRGANSETSHFGHGLSSDSTRFSHDISRMPDNPPKNLGHRRAHSEILTLPDDISFDSDLGVVGGLDGPSFSDETEEDLFSMYLDMDKFNTSSATSNFQLGDSSSAVAATPSSSTAPPPGENKVLAVNERPTRVRHQHSLSMDGSTTIKPEMLMSGSEDSISIDAKKSMSAAKLAELALVDPKRAKRIWANRQSAARSKERKMRYIAELERKVQALQTEATSLSAQLTLFISTACLCLLFIMLDPLFISLFLFTSMCWTCIQKHPSILWLYLFSCVFCYGQRDSNCLNAENSELKLRFQTMEQQVHLQDALNDALKEEIQHLKTLTGQNQMANGSGSNPMKTFSSYGGGNQQYYSNNNSMHTMLAAQQFQQLQIHSQKQKLQQHQLHQLQQQQLHQHQLEQQQLHQTGDLKVRTPIPSPSRKENSTEADLSAVKD